MLQHIFSGEDFSDEFNYAQISDHIDDAVYGSDEFRMYSYKIKRCPRTRSHDWTECPYAHRGEKAQRRDPRRFNYSGFACPAFRHGSCSKGDFCEFAHGVFEYWLHPVRYRTRVCNSGRFCQRKVCFFAHSPEQLRSEAKQKHHFRSGVPVTGESLPETRKKENISGKGAADVVNSLKGLKIRESGECERGKIFGSDVSDSDLPHIGWISELVQ